MRSVGAMMLPEITVNGYDYDDGVYTGLYDLYTDCGDEGSLFFMIIVGLLAVGGTLHVATDIPDYADQARAVCDAHPGLTGGVLARPDWRPVTRYEGKGLAAGRNVADLLYRRT